MNLANDLLKLKDMFTSIDEMQEFVDNAYKAYMENDLSSAHHFLHKAYQYFIDSITNYSLTELTALDQCYLFLTREYDEYKEQEESERRFIF